MSATPGPEEKAATGDPVVITRYLYKPDYWEGNTRFNDNRRRHIFLVGLGGGAPRALTSGTYEEHSIDWSPDGDEILCISNREPDPDLFYNPDVFAVRVRDGAPAAPHRHRERGVPAALLSRRAHHPVPGHPPGPHRPGDGHGGHPRVDHVPRRLRAGGSSAPRSTTARTTRPSPPTGPSSTSPSRTAGSVKLYRLPVAGGPAEAVVAERGRVTGYALGPRGSVAYTFASERDLAQLHWKEPASPARRLTDLNAEALRGVDIAPVEAFTFVSADFKWEVEAFLTQPLGFTGAGKHPLILMIHGGPHGAQGPAFNFKSQFYAGAGTPPFR